ncbi:MAG: T9SS type A sorting domain-containing protein [Ignavibacteria bacterium]|nr:T9SS type A sorting domain-containing protein [Ignavibacteria bacterium]
MIRKYFVSVYIILLIMISHPGFISAQSYLNFPIDTVVSDEFYNYRAYIRYDSAGRIHMVNSRQLGTNSATREVFYWNNVSGVMTPFRVTDNTVDDNYITFGFDQNENIHLGWERRDAGNLFQLIYTNNINAGTGFGDSVWITTGGINKATPYMAVGKNDSSVHFVYFTFVTGQDNAYYKKYNYISGILGPEITLGPAEAGSENDIEIAADDLGKIHIAYTTNASFGSGLLKYFNNESGTLTEIPTGVADNISYPDMTIDNNSTVHVIFRKSSDNRLYTLSRTPGGVFTAPVAITPSVGNPSFYRAIDTDETGRLYVTYQNSNSSFPRGTFLVHGKNGVFSDPILVFEDSTSAYIGRGNSSVAAMGSGDIAVHFEATASRNGNVVSDIFIKEGTLTVTGIELHFVTVLKDHILYDNYPNPFNPSTSISFYIPSGENVRLKIFDILGKEITILVNEFMSRGSHTVVFDAKGIPSGVYFYQIEAGNFSERKKMILTK